MTQSNLMAALAPDLGDGDGVDDRLSSREWDELVDIVVQLMEQRISDELSRRELRSTPRVF
jgi:hypothetical protein